MRGFSFTGCREEGGIMTEQDNKRQPRDAAFWARSGTVLRVSGVPNDALNLNVEGRRAWGLCRALGRCGKTPTGCAWLAHR
jgi:hypothetical protein